MDKTEAHVEKYLQHLAIGKVDFEPDGNVTPDFLVDGRIAVEARRLNQHHTSGTSGSKPEGLEQAEIPLAKRMHDLLSSYGAPTAGSASVTYRFSRPVESWRTLEPKIRVVLDRYRAANPKARSDVQIGQSFSLSIVPLSVALPTEFRPHLIVDEDSGGMYVDLMSRNLEIVIPEKQGKIDRRRTAYPEWWLVLVDHIGLEMDELEQALVRDQIKTAHTLDRVVVLSATDHTKAFIL